MKSEVSVMQGGLAAIGPAGCVLGAGLAGLLLAKTSPRKIMIICDIIGIVGTAIMCIPYYASCMIGRFINGFTIGISSADIPVINRQVSPEIILGVVGAIFSIQINIGIYIC